MIHLHVTGQKVQKALKCATGHSNHYYCLKLCNNVIYQEKMITNKKTIQVFKMFPPSKAVINTLGLMDTVPFDRRLGGRFKPAPKLKNHWPKSRNFRILRCILSMFLCTSPMYRSKVSPSVNCSIVTRLCVLLICGGSYHSRIVTYIFGNKKAWVSKYITTMTRFHFQF